MCNSCGSIGRSDQKCSECQNAIRHATKNKKYPGGIRRCYDSPKCSNPVTGKRLFCEKCWNIIPKQHQEKIRVGIEKGMHSLRAQPTKEWIAEAYSYLDSASRVKVQRPVDVI